MTIKEILNAEHINQQINVKGWVRTKRGGKSVSFITLNDGSTINNIQIVAEGSLFNEKLIKIRETFDNYPLIPALHSFMSDEDEKYKNLLPPLTLFSEEKKQELLSKLKELNFIPKTNSVAA